MKREKRKSGGGFCWEEECNDAPLRFERRVCFNCCRFDVSLSELTLQRAEEMINKMVEASVGASGAARCFSTLCR